MGYGRFEVDTGRVGCGGPLFEDGSDALANGSVRPALFPRTKHSSASGQLEGRFGTQNDRGHLAGTFHPSSGPLPSTPTATPSPQQSPDPGGPHCGSVFLVRSSI